MLPTATPYPSSRQRATIWLAVWLVAATAAVLAKTYYAGAEQRRADRQHSVEVQTMRLVDSLNSERKVVLMKLGLWLPPDSSGTDTDSLFAPRVPKPPPDYHTMLLASLRPGEDTSVVAKWMAELDSSSESHDVALRTRLTKSTAQHESIRQRAVTERRLGAAVSALAVAVLIATSAALALMWRGRRVAGIARP